MKPNLKLRVRIFEKYGTQEKFGKVVGCSRQMISRKLNNLTDMSRTEIKNWCEALDIPENEVGAYFF